MFAAAIWLDEPALICDLRQSEIEDLCVTALGHEDIGGLDIAMDDSLTMGRVQRIGDLNGERQYGFELNRPSRDEMLERDAVEEFHGDKRLAVLLANVVDRANVGMVQRRCCLRFALEARQCLSVARNVVRQEFEGYKTVKARVLSLVHHSHSTAAELSDYAVVRNRRVDHGRSGAEWMADSRANSSYSQ